MGKSGSIGGYTAWSPLHVRYEYFTFIAWKGFGKRKNLINAAIGEILEMM